MPDCIICGQPSSYQILDFSDNPKRHLCQKHGYEFEIALRDGISVEHQLEYMVRNKEEVTK